jgi:hypothetical protein
MIAVRDPAKVGNILRRYETGDPEGEMRPFSSAIDTPSITSSMLACSQASRIAVMKQRIRASLTEEGAEWESAVVWADADGTRMSWL